MRTSGLLLFSISIGLSFVGCGDDWALLPPSDNPRQNVLVIDEGIDPKSPALAHRVAARYTISCREDPPSSEPAPADFEEEKRRTIAAWQQRDDRCHLVEGIAAKPDPLERVARYRERWNRLMRQSRWGVSEFYDDEWQELQDAFDEALSSTRWHGTATSSVVAYQNRDVRLVLIEEELGNSEEAMASFTCLEQEDFDHFVALWSDPEVRQAYLDSPAATIDDEIDSVIEQFAVGVVNESYGSWPRATLEQLQADKGCPAIDLRRYFALQAELVAARSLAHPAPNVLVVQAAGNEQAQIDTVEDATVCAGTSQQRLVAGAYDLREQYASFTNFGACVDVFAPGVNVLGELPGSWLLPVQGTSFSTPLVARLVSLEARSPFSTRVARDEVISAEDGLGRIPIERFPHSIFYDPPTTQSLRRVPARAAATRSPSRLSERQLRALLRPFPR